MSRRYVLGLVLLATGFVAGCSDADNPDAGGTPQVQASGVAVDGYVGGALVFADLDNNGRPNDFEPRARTDAFGFYSFRPEFSLDGVTVPERDYCLLALTAPTPAARRAASRHCLRIPATSPEARIRIRGGFDSFTGEAFEGELSRFLAFNAASPRALSAVTPLTSVQNGLVEGLGDFLDGQNTGGSFDGTQAGLAAEIHAAVQHLARRITATATDLDDADKDRLPGLIRARLLDGAAGDGLPARWDSLDAQDFQALAAAVLSALGSSASPAGLGDDLLAFRNVIVQLRGGTRSEVEARLLAISAYGQARGEDTGVDPGDMSRFVTLRNGINARTAGDEHRRMDRRRLRERFRDSGDTLADLSDAVVSDQFPSLSGKKLTIQSTGDNGGDSDARVDLYFVAEVGGDKDGPLVLCVSGLDGVDLSDDFSDDDSGASALRLTGRWSQPTRRALVLALTAFGGTFNATAALRLGPSPGGGPLHLAFDYEGKRSRLSLPRNAGLDSYFTDIGTDEPATRENATEKNCF